MEYFALIDQNHGLTPLENPHFFVLFNFLFLWSRQALLRCVVVFMDLTGVFLFLAYFSLNEKMGKFPIFD